LEKDRNVAYHLEGIKTDLDVRKRTYVAKVIRWPIADLGRAR
jgi:hypothetical protein